MKVVGWVVVITICLVALSVIGAVFGWFGRAADVVSHETDPAVIQEKYTWFKKASAQLDAQNANITVSEEKIKAHHCDTATDRVHIEQCGVWEQETQGMIGGFNLLAGQYNAEMANWAWRFANVGQLPAGATNPLPREYKPYITH